MRALDSQFVISASELRGAPPPGRPEVAFLGRSNVGKSSMINALLARKKLARVSNTPGRTQLLNFFEVTVETAPGEKLLISLCDLPGYGYAKAPRAEIDKWRVMIENYLRNRITLKVAVALIDSRHGPTVQDQSLYAWMVGIGRPTITVATKIDKLTKAQKRPALKEMAQQLGADRPLLGFSSETGEGMEEVWAAIATAARQK